MPIPDHFATVDKLLQYLGTSRNQYFGFIRANRTDLYHEFEIPGPRGKIRKICAPHPYLKEVQERLKEALEELYRAPSAAHGFISGRSIVTNARFHRGKRHVLNIDLDDFFPTITQARIAGLLASSRYMLLPKVANFISHMVTYNGSLPQGAPTSPILSNMIAARLDSKLTALAKEAKALYTRYADDLTFSTSLKQFPTELIASTDPLELGEQLLQIIRSEGFSLNTKKTRCSTRYVRQRVTGLVVNRFPNVLRKRVNEVRAILHDWKHNGEEAANKHFLNLRTGRKANSHAMRRYVEGQIAFVSMVRGDADPVVLRLLHEYRRRLDSMYAVTQDDYLCVARSLFGQVESEIDMQKAGYLLENAFSALANADQIRISSPFRAIGGAIQVDGAIQVHGNDYWVECKWLKEAVGSNGLENLVGKLAAAPAGTRGILISRMGFAGFGDKYQERTHTQFPIIRLPYQELRRCVDSGEGLSALIARLWTALVTQ